MAPREHATSYILMSLALALSACGDDDPNPDAGAPTDAAPGDAGAPDAGPPVDMGISDVGRPDTGAADMGSSDAGADALEIAGVWASNFGAEEVITSVAFNAASVVEYDNARNELVTQSSTSAEFNPGLFNKIVWTDIQDDRFYYCTVDFGLPTAEAARSSPMTADPSDPDNGGCGGFPWTRLRRAISIRGRYTSNFGGMETITATVWSQSGPSMRLVDWDEMSNVVITQNAMEAMFNPSLFNKIEFTEPGPEGSFYYCFSDFGLMTEEAARTSTQSADPSTPEMDGCGGFPWTRLNPR